MPINRQPAGTPTGGRFAPSAHTEGEVDLTAEDRTDVHRPIALVTEDYEFYSVIDHEDDDEIDECVGFNEAVRSYVEANGHRFAGVHPPGQCDHCGAHLRYAALLVHMPTGELVEVGETCLDNRFSFATTEFQARRKKAELNRQRQRIRQAVAEFVADDPDLAWMAENERDALPEHIAANHFLMDVAHRRHLRVWTDTA